MIAERLWIYFRLEAFGFIFWMRTSITQLPYKREDFWALDVLNSNRKLSCQWDWDQDGFTIPPQSLRASYMRGVSQK